MTKKNIKNIIYILACLIIAWIVVSFIETTPYIEGKQLKSWNFFEILIKIGDKIQEWKEVIK